MRSLVLAAVFLLVLPATARAAELASIVSRDVPIRGGERALASSTPRFNLVGLHWRGTGAVEFRTRSLAGRWSAWRPAAPEDEDRPDRFSGERTVSGWNVGNPYWAGASDRLEVRTRGRVTRVRAHYVWSPVERAPARTLSVAASPPIIPRSVWGANELIRRAPPSYATTLGFAVVHHTAGSNDYTREQSAAIVKAIQLYHVQGNGWNDVGYNFLVDKYGQVFEGRYGGIERNVVGAHAEGFNTGSVGVALLGNYQARSVTAAAQKALADLVSWRLDVAHVDPLSTLSWTSGGNAKFPRGVPVFLRSIIGHRDTGFTACPGNVLYAKLDALAASVAETGLPKLYEPRASGGIGGPVRFTGRLSSDLPWTVTVTDAAGTTVATGSGSTAAVDWTWDATAAPPGAYAWAIAGPNVRIATGTIGRAAALGISRARANPAAVTPNGDGRDDSTSIEYVLSAPATVTASLVDPAGTTVATLFSEQRAAGQQGFVFTAEGIADGAYTIVLVAADAKGKQVQAAIPLLVTRTLSGFTVPRARFSPNGDGRLDTIPFTFALAAPATARLRILLNGKWVATPFDGPLEAGAQRLVYDGAKRLGRLPDGAYEAELSVTDAVGTVTQRLPFVSDTRAPSLRLVSTSPLRLDVSEPATVVIWFDGRRRTVTRGQEGVFWAAGRVRNVRAIAYDDAGNRSAVLRYRR
jgi:hypothetical protein